MDTKDILYVLRNKLGNKTHFAGVFSSDQVRDLQIPLTREKPIALIANILRKDDERMGHWTVFTISESPQKYIYFYDSYGLNPDIYTPDFKAFIEKNRSYEIYTFNRKLQHSTSSVCGLYCAQFIYLISRYAISKVVEILRRVFPTEHGRNNDRKVYDFYINNLNVRSCQYWKSKKDGMVSYEQCMRFLKRGEGDDDEEE